MDLGFLPTVNAALNGVATVLLIVGRVLVHRGRIEAHRRTMIAAFGVSSVFLLFYVLHKWSKNFENTVYEGEYRGVYLAILGTHLVLAMAVPVMAIRLLVLGTRGDLPRHRRLARIAWPIWIYVSVTGVVIYAMLYL